MTSTAAPPELSAKVRTRTRSVRWAGSRGRRAKPREHRGPGLPVALALLVLAVLVGGWLWWLASGLLGASGTVQDQAAVAQSELQKFRDSLTAGHDAAARSHLKAGEAALAKAQDAAGARPVRVAKGLPWVGSTVDDLDHLLAAAQIMTTSGADALAVYDNFSGENSKLFHDGTFSIPAIHQAQASVTAIGHSLDRAQAELEQVTGNGPKGAEALAKKRSALHQVTSLRQQVASLAPLLDSMPSAVGADGPKTYLVAIMNPSEMRASGGAPLSVAFVKFDDGKMSLLAKKGATSALTGMNAKEYWNRLTGKRDPFAAPAGQAERFVNTNVNPDFATSGEQMRRATKANFGVKTDGVIALDLTAIGHLLDLTGPIKTGYYGTITGQNIANKLVVKAYQNSSGNADTDVTARHDVNDRLMTVMLNRLTEGGGLVGKARALGLAVPGRHLELYFSDPALQKVVVAEGLGGTIPVRRTGNLTAVYTQNGNGNKMDVFQRRTVTERVKLRADGSALVRRTVALENPTPPYTAPFADRHVGYDTRWATNLVINLMPKGSRVVNQPVVTMVGTVGSGVDQDGRTYAKAAVMLPPDGRASLTWSYVVPHAAVVRGDRMYFRDYVAPQSMLRTPTLDLQVVAPQGWTAAAAPGWTASDKGASASLPIDHLQVLKLLLQRS
ncbi:MAG TPA: DUF4012 domain-containing protein [Actinomycetes bacterium]